MSMSK